MVSLSAPPPITSLPSPPVSRSAPAPPFMLSFPAPPSMTSAPSSPTIMSLSSPPQMGVRYARADPWITKGQKGIRARTRCPVAEIPVRIDIEVVQVGRAIIQRKITRLSSTEIAYPRSRIVEEVHYLQTVGMPGER